MRRHNPVFFLPLFCIPCISVDDRRPTRCVVLFLPAVYCTACNGWHTIILFPSFLPYFVPLRFNYQQSYPGLIWSICNRLIIIPISSWIKGRQNFRMLWRSIMTHIERCHIFFWKETLYWKFPESFPKIKMECKKSLDFKILPVYWLKLIFVFFMKIKTQIV